MFMVEIKKTFLHINMNLEFVVLYVALCISACHILNTITWGIV